MDSKPDKYKAMIENAYSYLFHCSEYRDADRKWACFHREDESVYWNGNPNRWGKTKSARIALGSTPELAWEAVKQLEKEDAAAE